MTSSRAVSIDDIVSRYLPNAPSLHPATGIDSRAIPYSLHLLYADDLTDQVLCRIEQSPSVVGYWRFSQAEGKGTNLVVTADFDQHREARQNDPLRIHDKPVYWHLQITQSPPSRYPHIPPGRRQIEQAMVLSDHVGLFSSAHDIRLVTLRETAGFQDRLTSAHKEIDSASRAGRCYYFPTSSIPFGVHHFQFSDHGGTWHNALVVHEQVGPLGPWIVAEYPDSDEMEDKLQQILGRIYLVPNRVRVKDPVRVLPAPPRHDRDFLWDITPQGTMTTQLRLRLRSSLAQKRLSSRHSRDAKPTRRLISGNSRIGTCFLFVSVSQHDKFRHADTVVAQVVAMIENPPPGVDSHFENVDKIVILVEILPRRTAFGNRRAITQLRLKSGNVASRRIMATNIYRLVSTPDEVALARRDFPDLIVLGLPRKPVGLGIYGVGLAEEEELQDEEDDLDEVAWSDGWDERIEGHVQCRRACSTEHSFYKGRDRFMERHFSSLMAHREFGHAIRQYCRQHKLETIYIFRRISQGPIGEHNEFNHSLDKQQAFLTGIAGHELPPVHIVTLKHESIGRDNAAILDGLEGISNALVLAISLDRVARNNESFNQLETLCQAKTVHLATVIWPTWAIASLGVTINPLIDHNPAAVHLLASVRNMARDPRSLPSLCPTVVIGLDDPHVRQVVRQALAESELFISSLSSPNYSGDKTCRVPDTIGRHPGWPSSNNARLGSFVSGIIPWFTGELDVFSYKGPNAAQCLCVQDACVQDCSCTCDVCMSNYGGECPCDGSDNVPFCPCTCPDHHVKEE